MSDAQKLDPSSLPPLPDAVAAFRDKGTFTMPEQFYPADVIDAREALRAQAATAPNLACKSAQARLATQWGYVRAASVEPVGSIDHVEWSASKEQWRHNIWADKKIPFGTKLYAGAPPAHIPADVGALVVRLNNWRSSGESEWAMGVNSGIDAAVQITQAWGRTTQAVAASSPATAVDAGIGQHAEYWGGLAQQKADADVRRGVTMPVSYYASTVVAAALQASRQPVTQQAVAASTGANVDAGMVPQAAPATKNWYCGNCRVPVPNPELPGMWHASDFTGGETDTIKKETP